uniref:Uncharacterized protein n=1 Tax=Setaria digitata TaxID=48799 RepID=A0A915Q6I0_9BILA
MVAGPISGAALKPFFVLNQHITRPVAVIVFFLLTGAVNTESANVKLEIVWELISSKAILIDKILKLWRMESYVDL